MKIRQSWKRYIKPVVACGVAFCIVNALFFAYRLDAGWLTRGGGCTAGVYMPGSYITNMAEGMGGIRRVDENGYLNQSADLDDDYVLVMGKSHTNAVEVMPDKRYVSLLNERLKNGDKVKVYSVARGGATFPELLKGVNALTEEFPNSTAIVIEMDEVGGLEELKDSLNQKSYQKNDEISYLIENKTSIDVIKGIIKEKFPLVAYLLDIRMGQIDFGFENAFGIKSKKQHVVEYEDLTEEYDATLNEVFQMLRKKYQGQIIILYHPTVQIDASGELLVQKMEYYDCIKKQCEANNIFFCDVSNEFLDAYEKNRTVPYGFENTAMGIGHLNVHGHKILADTLYEQYFCR